MARRPRRGEATKSLDEAALDETIKGCNDRRQGAHDALDECICTPRSVLYDALCMLRMYAILCYAMPCAMM
eukprot:9467867-Pyramimonas_sp.AAC.2